MRHRRHRKQREEAVELPVQIIFFITCWLVCQPATQAEGFTRQGQRIFKKDSLSNTIGEGWKKNGRFLERENLLLGFLRMHGACLLPLRSLSKQGAALLGGCRNSMQEDTQFRLGMSGLQGLHPLWSSRLTKACVL